MMAEAAVDVNRFFCHQCNHHISVDRANLKCPLCQSGFIEEIDSNSATNESASSDVDAQATSGNMASPLEMIHHSFMHYWPSPETPSGASFEDPADGISFFQINLQPQQGTAASTANGQGDDVSSARPGARTERYNLRQRRRPSPTSRTGSNNRVESGPMPQDFFIEDFLQQILNGMEPTAMFGPTATLRNARIGTHPATPWGMFSLHGNPGDYAWGSNGLDNIITQLLGQLDSSGPPPAAAATIQRLPTLVITEADVELKKECSVCMDTFVVNDNAKKLPCLHIFHIHCIDPWLKLHNTCPICRKNVERLSSSNRGCQGASSSRSQSRTGTSSSGIYYGDGQE